MSIDLYSCHVCGEDFCNDCNPSLECYICHNNINEDCQAEEAKSDYGDFIICADCYKKGSKKEQEEWRKLKNRLLKTERETKTEIKLKSENPGQAMRELQERLNSLR